MTLILSDDDVRVALDARSLVDAIELVLKEDERTPADVPERMNLASSDRFFRVMPTIVPASGVMGLKVFHGGAGIGVRYVVMLTRMSDGEVLAVMDACHLTAARTAATSALAARVIAGPRSRLGVLGSGLEAEAHARTLAGLGDVELIKIYSPSAGNRERLAARLRESLSVEVVSCDSAEQACTGIDHLITATNTGNNGPTACRAEWLSPGLHISAIGSTHDKLRELETDVLRGAGCVVFDADPDQIATESGDIIAYLAEGGSLDGVITLSQLLHGTATIPASVGDGYTIFKSVGTAVQDMVAANLAYQAALSAGIGHSIPELAVPKSRR